MPDAVHLYLIRHAIAHERGEAWPDDRIRPLTEDGVARMARQAHGLVALDVSFDEILTSPLVRARQTADILADAYRASPRIVEVPALEPGRTYQLSYRTQNPAIAGIGLAAFRDTATWLKHESSAPSHPRLKLRWMRRTR